MPFIVRARSERRKKSYKRLLTSANGAELARHSALKIFKNKKISSEREGKRREVCGRVWLRRLWSASLPKKVFLMIVDSRVERLRHETAVTHAQLRSCGVSELCSPLPTTTIAHISVIQFIVPFVRARTATHSHSSLNRKPRKAIVCCLCIVIVVGVFLSVSLLCCGSDNNVQKIHFLHIRCFMVIERCRRMERVVQ